jgi:protein phosphatase
MELTCPACGAVSQDPEFCDRCNADLTPPPAALPPLLCPLRPDNPLSLSQQQAILLSRPESALTVQNGTECWRIHWVPASAWPLHGPGLEARSRSQLAALAPCRIVHDRSGTWVFVEAVPERWQPWREPPAADPLADLRRLASAVDLLANALAELHEHGLVCLSFDPRELEAVPQAAPTPGNGPARLRFTGLDLAVYPQGLAPARAPLHPRFAAPEAWRFQGGSLDARTDVFHLALFAYCWLARLLPDGIPGSGLQMFQYALPFLRTFAPTLPPGVIGVVNRGLSLEPRHRQAAPREFAAALRLALDRAERRWQSNEPVRWEAALHTRTGRSKFALHRTNEDHGFLCRFRDPERAVLGVADGISICDVGSGALASRLACLVVENSFDRECHEDTFPERVKSACRRSAEYLLSWALEHGHRQKLLDGMDLMGTTLTVAWLEGNHLSVANLGDSRAYLIDSDVVEQLTVDGDLGSSLLALGVPPEDVQQLGSMARALQDCIGGCARTVEGELTIREEHCSPRVTRWPLLPGDVVILCTDGLVEEGVFLEPVELAEIARKHRDLPAETLAIKLADAADSRQRLPSILEPDGFGDNVTCLVIKVLPQGGTP